MYIAIHAWKMECSSGCDSGCDFPTRERHYHAPPKADDMQTGYYCTRNIYVSPRGVFFLLFFLIRKKNEQVVHSACTCVCVCVQRSGRARTFVCVCKRRRRRTSVSAFAGCVGCAAELHYSAAGAATDNVFTWLKNSPQDMAWSPLTSLLNKAVKNASEYSSGMSPSSAALQNSAR